LGNIEDVIARSVEKTIAPSEKFIEEIKNIISSAGNLNHAIDSIMQLKSPSEIGAISEAELLRSVMLGHLEVHFGEMKYRLNADVLPWTEIAPEKAIEFFKTQKLIPTKAFKRLAKSVAAKSKEMAGDYLEYTQEHMKKMLLEALENGETPYDFLKKFDEMVGGIGISSSAKHYLETFYETNMAGARAYGRWSEQRDPEVIKALPMWQYKTMNDGRVREGHQAMSDRIYPAKDPIWDIWYPPKGVRCRCYVSALPDGEVSPPFAGKPDPGFDQSPAEFFKK